MVLYVIKQEKSQFDQYEKTITVAESSTLHGR